MKKSATKNNDAALNAFIETNASAIEKAKAILEYLENHQNTSPEEINWGHQGSASYINGQLNDLLEFINN